VSEKEDAKEHDACVLEIAKKLKKDKWEVNADLEGWSKPDKIGDATPDVVAKKPGCMTRICEIATPAMFNGNLKEYQELKNYCAEYDFHFYIVKDGKKVEIDPNDLKKIGKK
jgi:hypothetical protein